MAGVAPPVGYQWGPHAGFPKCGKCGADTPAGGWIPGTVCPSNALPLPASAVTPPVIGSKRSREEEQEEEQKIERLKAELVALQSEREVQLAQAAAAADETLKAARYKAAASKQLAIDGVQEEINDRRKRLKSAIPGLTSSPYFTHEDVDSERWFKRLICLSDAAEAAGKPPIIVEDTDENAVLGAAVESGAMPLALRVALRFSSFRILDRVSVCPPSDDAAGNDTVAWLLKAKEPKLQWSVLQLLRAAAGDQTGMDWQAEDSAQPQPREDLRGFVQARKVSAAELKKKLSQNLTANAEGLGQIGRYGARDCKQGDYMSILSSLSYCLFVRITYKNENEVERYRVYPRIDQVHHLGMLLAADLEHVDQGATKLQSILPTATPPAFASLVRFIDAICTVQGVPVTMPVVYLRTAACPAESVWILSRPRVLHQTLRSLLIGADHFDPAAGRQVVIKAAAAVLVDREEAIHHLVDGKVSAIRRAVGRVRITGGCKDLEGLVLDPLGDPVDKLLISGVDVFAESAATVLKELHAAGVWHRDVKPGNFLTVAGRLLLNDFDLSAPAADPSNTAFQSGTPRFASPYLSDSHTYSARDDFMSLIFTVVELAQKDMMDSVGHDAVKKLQLLQDLKHGRKVITPNFQKMVAKWMESD